MQAPSASQELEWTASATLCTSGAEEATRRLPNGTAVDEGNASMVFANCYSNVDDLYALGDVVEVGGGTSGSSCGGNDDDGEAAWGLRPDLDDGAWPDRDPAREYLSVSQFASVHSGAVGSCGATEAAPDALKRQRWHQHGGAGAIHPQEGWTEQLLAQAPPATPSTSKSPLLAAARGHRARGHTSPQLHRKPPRRSPDGVPRWDGCASDSQTLLVSEPRFTPSHSMVGDASSLSLLLLCSRRSESYSESQLCRGSQDSTTSVGVIARMMQGLVMSPERPTLPTLAADPQLLAAVEQENQLVFSTESKLEAFFEENAKAPPKSFWLQHAPWGAASDGARVGGEHGGNGRSGPMSWWEWRHSGGWSRGGNHRRRIRRQQRQSFGKAGPTGGPDEVDGGAGAAGSGEQGHEPQRDARSASPGGGGEEEDSTNAHTRCRQSISHGGRNSRCILDRLQRLTSVALLADAADDGAAESDTQSHEDVPPMTPPTPAPGAPQVPVTPTTSPRTSRGRRSLDAEAAESALVAVEEVPVAPMLPVSAARRMTPRHRKSAAASDSQAGSAAASRSTSCTLSLTEHHWHSHGAGGIASSAGSRLATPTTVVGDEVFPAGSDPRAPSHSRGPSLAVSFSSITKLAKGLVAAVRSSGTSRRQSMPQSTSAAPGADAEAEAEPKDNGNSIGVTPTASMGRHPPDGLSDSNGQLSQWPSHAGLSSRGSTPSRSPVTLVPTSGVLDRGSGSPLRSPKLGQFVVPGSLGTVSRAATPLATGVPVPSASPPAVAASAPLAGDDLGSSGAVSRSGSTGNTEPTAGPLQAPGRRRSVKRSFPLRAVRSSSESGGMARAKAKAVGDSSGAASSTAPESQEPPTLSPFPATAVPTPPLTALNLPRTALPPTSASTRRLQHRCSVSLTEVTASSNGIDRSSSYGSGGPGDLMETSLGLPTNVPSMPVGEVPLTGRRRSSAAGPAVDAAPGKSAAAPESLPARPAGPLPISPVPEGVVADARRPACVPRGGKFLQPFSELLQFTAMAATGVTGTTDGSHGPDAAIGSTPLSCDSVRAAGATSQSTPRRYYSGGGRAGGVERHPGCPSELGTAPAGLLSEPSAQPPPSSQGPVARARRPSVISFRLATDAAVPPRRPSAGPSSQRVAGASPSPDGLVLPRVDAGADGTSDPRRPAGGGPWRSAVERDDNAGPLRHPERRLTAPQPLATPLSAAEVSGPRRVVEHRPPGTDPRRPTGDLHPSEPVSPSLSRTLMPSPVAPAPTSLPALPAVPPEQRPAEAEDAGPTATGDGALPPEGLRDKRELWRHARRRVSQIHPLPPGRPPSDGPLEPGGP